MISDRWTWRGADFPAIRERVRLDGTTGREAKLHFAEVGLCLARAEGSAKGSGVSAPSMDDLISRAVYWARWALHDGELRPSRVLPLHEGMALPDIADKASGDRHAREVESLLACGLSPQQLKLCEAFLDGDCSTLSEAARWLGRPQGTAFVQAARIRKKADAA